MGIKIVEEDEIMYQSQRQILDKVGTIYQYQVEAGDHLFEISRKFDSDPKMIAGLNDLDPNGILSIGQKLYIPVLDKPRQTYYAPMPYRDMNMLYF